MDLHGFFNFYNLTMFIDGQARNMPTVLKLCKEKV